MHLAITIKAHNINTHTHHKHTYCTINTDHKYTHKHTIMYNTLTHAHMHSYTHTSTHITQVRITYTLTHLHAYYTITHSPHIHVTQVHGHTLIHTQAHDSIDLQIVHLVVVCMSSIKKPVEEKKIVNQKGPGNQTSIMARIHVFEDTPHRTHTVHTTHWHITH